MYSYDAKGNQTDTQYLDQDFNLISQEYFGYTRIHSEYDRLGNETEVSYWTADNFPAFTKDGDYVFLKKIYEDNHLMEVQYWGADTELTLHSRYGYAIVRYEYDDNGRTLSELYYGKDGNLIIHKENHCAGKKYAYDAKGNQTNKIGRASCRERV